MAPIVIPAEPTKARLPVVVIPTVFTVPTVNTVPWVNDTTPALAAKVVTAFAEPVLVRVNVPLPKISNPEAATFCDWVTVPAELKVVLPVVVRPTVFTVPIPNPLFSRKETLPVLPAKVVIALPVLVSV